MKSIKKHPWSVIGVVVILLLGTSIVYANYVTNKANAGVTITDHVTGNPDVAVTLTEYGDFECPACGQFHPLVKQVMDQYGDKIRFQFKNFPLISVHPYAVPAAKAAEAAAQQGKFFEMYDKLYQNQNTWAQAGNPQPYFEQYASDIGLNVGQFKTQMKASVIDKHIQDAYKEARDKGLTSTPTFYLNGTKMQFNTFADFLDQIHSALGVATSSASSTVTTSPSNKTNGSDVRFGL